MKSLIILLLINTLVFGTPSVPEEKEKTESKLNQVKSVVENVSLTQRSTLRTDHWVEQQSLDDKLESELESYHEIKKRIQFLEDHLKQHASFNLIETDDLVAAASTLQTIKRTVIQPLETNLLAVRSQIKKGDHNLTSEELHFVKSVLDNADGFLRNSEERIQQIELIENEWDSQEESEKIRQAAESTLNQQKERKRIVGDAANPNMFRSKKLQRVKDLISKKEKLKYMTTRKSVVNSADLDELKLRLDLEIAEDAEPGFAKKRINEALQKAAEQSHKFIDANFPHGEHKDHILKQLAEDENAPSWILVFSLAGISSGLMIILMFMICSRRNTQPWKRNLFKSPANGTRPGTYCELDEVKHEEKETPMTLTNLSATPWLDNSWGDWSEKRTQKQK